MSQQENQFAIQRHNEWQFLFEHCIDWKKILPLYSERGDTVAVASRVGELKDILDRTNEWVSTNVATRARSVDEAGPGKLVDSKILVSEPLKTTLSEMKDLGMSSLSVSTEWGGLGLPLSLSLLVFQSLSRGCISTSTYAAFTVSFSDMLERFADKDIVEKYVPLLASGQFSGSMCLTEPDSGSDLAGLKCRARPLAKEGHYELHGTKIFITNGAGGLALVLAKIEGAPRSLDGLSLFFAEQWTEGSGPNYEITKLEDKLGMKGSATCEVVFNACPARLIGKPGEGFRLMQHLMNEARISVGLQALGGIEGALHCAEEYSLERIQFDRPIAELPLFKKNMEDMNTCADALRAYLVDTVSWFDIYQRLDLVKRQGGELTKEQEELFKTAFAVVRFRTPLTKYFATEEAARIALKCVQAHGGYGYMKDYDIERQFRDIVGGLLYEGTSQVQSLMTMKDLMKLMSKNPVGFIQSWLAKHPVTVLTGGARRKRLRTLEYAHTKALLGLMLRTLRPGKPAEQSGLVEMMSSMRKLFKMKSWLSEEGVSRLMRHAEEICEGLAIIEILKVLDAQATQHASRDDLFWKYEKIARPRLVALSEAWRVQPIEQDV